MKLAFLLVVSSVLFGQSAGQPADDLARIQSEPNAEKRAREALDNADEALKLARETYGVGNTADTLARLEEVQQSIELADSSLKETGKNPSRSPKNFKAAELRTRGLLRKLEGFRDQMSVADRAVADRVVAEVQKIHDGWLDAIMGKKK
jgi:hypothetical protein